MEISIHFKTGGERGLSQHGPYDFGEEEFIRLKKDFLTFVEEGQPKGGAYRCRFNNTPREVVLKFDEIVYFG